MTEDDAITGCTIESTAELEGEIIETYTLATLTINVGMTPKCARKIADQLHATVSGLAPRLSILTTITGKVFIS